MPDAEPRRVLACMAHPDDVEFRCAGTLALLHQRGWEVHIATMTPGDGGSDSLSREEIGRIRTGEAAAAAAMLDGHYHCLGLDDVFIIYDRASLLKTIELLRRVRPRLVLTHSPEDYFSDHEHAAQLVRTACFGATVPNVETPGAAATTRVPHLYYADAADGKDIYGEPLPPSVYVDTTGVIATKERMLCCHASQRAWLLAHHGMDEYAESMKLFSALRGGEIGVAHAEGFRQHLGHGYPQDNLLKMELGGLVVEREETR